MARYRLRSAHYFPGDKLLLGDNEVGDNGGTIVGDGTGHEVLSPTIEMIPLDAEAEEGIRREEERLNGATMSPVDQLPSDLDDDYIPGFNRKRKP